MFLIFSLVFIDSFHLVLNFLAWQLPLFGLLSILSCGQITHSDFCFSHFLKDFLFIYFVLFLPSFLPRLPFRVFSLASFSSFFFFFWEFYWLSLNCIFFVLSIWQTSIILEWICIPPWYPVILSNALSFFLTWLNTLFIYLLNISYFFFSSSSSIWLNFFSWWIFIFSHPSQLEWSFMESHISCVFWWISILSQLDENSCIHFSLLFFFFGWSLF